MKLTKILMTGVLGVAMISASCSSDDDRSGVNSSDDNMNANNTEHPENAEHPENSEHPENGSKINHPDKGEHPAQVSKVDHTSGNEMHETSREVERQEVKLTLLPPAITETLKGDEYIDCKVERAYVIKENDTKIYEINVKKHDDKATFMFNDKGVRINRK